jgi:hypothetical protein
LPIQRSSDKKKAFETANRRRMRERDEAEKRKPRDKSRCQGVLARSIWRRSDVEPAFTEKSNNKNSSVNICPQTHKQWNEEKIKKEESFQCGEGESENVMKKLKKKKRKKCKLSSKEDMGRALPGHNIGHHRKRITELRGNWGRMSSVLVQTLTGRFHSLSIRLFSNLSSLFWFLPFLSHFRISFTFCVFSQLSFFRNEIWLFNSP